MAAVASRGLTDQQRQAVDARGVSVALSAGAGCGKTFVLTERFLSQLEPTADRAPKLSQLVAITFTERAAREMRDRIRRTCRQRLHEAPDEQAEYWQDLIRQLDSARISTIHSFCAGLLRAHAVQSGLDPQFRVLQQAQSDTLVFELIDDVLRERLAEQDDAVIDFVVEFGLASLREMIARLLGRRQDIQWSTWQSVTPDQLVSRWAAYQQDVSLPTLVESIGQSSPARALMEIIRSNRPNHPEMQSRCDALAQRLGSLTKTHDPEADLESIRQNARVQGGGGKKAWPSEDVYQRFRDAAKQLRELIDESKQSFTFDPETARDAAEAGLRLLAVTHEVSSAYESKKQEQAALDFDDLLIRARDLLTSPDHRNVRQSLSSQTALVLVDEFQDTDPLQVELVEALTGQDLTRGKLFFVGDFKQSIYRFRGADPHVFQRLRETTPPDGRLPLTMNFRSQPAVLDFVNALFCEDLGPEYERLEPNRVQVTPEPAIEFIWAPDETPKKRTGRSERLRQKEADWIARRLRSMLDDGQQIVWDEETAAAGKPAARCVRPGDIAILFRALSDVQHYEAALQRYAIDYYLVGGHAFYAQQEVFDLLNLLRSVASCTDEVSLAGVLRRPMFSLEDETLFWLVQHSGSLNAGLANPPSSELTPDQQKRLSYAAKTLAELRAIKDRVLVAELVQESMERTAYDAALLAEFMGGRKLANLRKLIDQARSFDRSGMFSLTDFITQLSEFVARQPDEPLAATSPETADVVRLMTVHQAKGLEFPVVVVPDMDRRLLGSRSSVAFTRELGPLVKMPSGSSGYDLHAMVERKEEQAELVRLLYVASTRAADYLIVSSGLTELGSFRGPWAELLSRRFDSLTGGLRAELPAGYGTPNVKVTVSEPPLTDTRTKGRRRTDLRQLIERTAEASEKGTAKVPQYLGPVAPDLTARRQYSFSRLSGQVHETTKAFDGTEDAVKSPTQLDPLGLGTLVHAVLAEVDFFALADVQSLVRRLAPRHLPETKDGLAEPIAMIRRFLNSPRAAEIAAAKEVHPELEFLLVWPPPSSPAKKEKAKQPLSTLTDPSSVTGDETGSASASPTDSQTPQPPIYLQGFIDCVYKDRRGGWHVVDYKTNRVSRESLDAVAAEYEMQMLLYGLAVEQILGHRPRSLVLHFLRPSLERHFDWDAGARRRIVRMVDRGLSDFAGIKEAQRQ